ncbi:hypothetical protein PTSG_09720 [Salpingoeca rosetta]|uniref:Uncharacterized protein n=1 Tax=Salpingoeca rosetta (strain ATCC 50818 / BSB-021) TaxID=946362 RepID=F2UNU9_SALR5|nr:uncharacterized protein PTSG_09720 [Salpingoeca rosetta]EGD79304.1 hypothetical protein PTSG_09720 [Salpingoeca rosetta]|eukprot:XP_004989075.1 hypothetical protein PTSG_09720 [Salpingoeca rosetta]
MNVNAVTLPDSDPTQQLQLHRSSATARDSGHEREQSTTATTTATAETTCTSSSSSSSSSTAKMPPNTTNTTTAGAHGHAYEQPGGHAHAVDEDAKKPDCASPPASTTCTSPARSPEAAVSPASSVLSDTSVSSINTTSSSDADFMASFRALPVDTPDEASQAVHTPLAQRRRRRTAAATAPLRTSISHPATPTTPKRAASLTSLRPSAIPSPAQHSRRRPRQLGAGLHSPRSSSASLSSLSPPTSSSSPLSPPSSSSSWASSWWSLASSQKANTPNAVHQHALTQQRLPRQQSHHHHQQQQQQQRDTRTPSVASSPSPTARAPHLLSRFSSPASKYTHMSVHELKQQAAAHMDTKERYLAAEALYNLAGNQQKQGRTKESMRTYRTCLRLNPHHAPAHFALAVVHETRGSVAKAVKHYISAMEIVPSHAAAISALARLLLASNTGDVRPALALLERLHALDACEHEDHVRLAHLHRTVTRKLDAAAYHYQAALAMVPHDVGAAVALAHLYEEDMCDLGAAHRQWLAVAAMLDGGDDDGDDGDEVCGDEEDVCEERRGRDDDDDKDDDDDCDDGRGAGSLEHRGLRQVAAAAVLRIEQRLQSAHASTELPQMI